MTLTLLDVWRAARARSVPFAAESAGHLALSACEEIALAPRQVALQSVELMADGSVRVRGSEASGSFEAEAELRELLRLLLEVASSPGIALVRTAARAATGNLAGLAVELEKALIPVNRAAARRALVRLYRETERAIAAGRLAPAPTALVVETAPPAAVLAPPAAVLAPPAAVLAPPAAVLAPPAAVLAPPAVVLEPAYPEFVTIAPASAAPEPVEPVEPAEHAAAEHTDVSAVHAVAEPEREILTRPETSAARRDSKAALAWIDVELHERTEPAPSVSDVSSVACELTLDSTGNPPDVGAIEVPSWNELPSLHEDELCFDLLDDAERVELEPASMDSGWLEPLLPVESYPGLPPQKSDVRELLVAFEVAAPLGEAELRRELKALSGVDLTPGPPADLVPCSRIAR